MIIEPMSIRIKKLRKKLGLTQDEFGKRIMIKRNTIANYETGRNEPIDGVLYSMCREFNVSEKWLKTGEGGDEAMFNLTESSLIDIVAAKYGLDSTSRNFLLIYLEQPTERQQIISMYLHGFFKTLVDGAESFQAMLNSETNKLMNDALKHPHFKKEILKNIKRNPSILENFKIANQKESSNPDVGTLEIHLDELKKLAPQRDWAAEVDTAIDFHANAPIDKGDHYVDERDYIKSQIDIQEQIDMTRNKGKKKGM